MPIESRATVTIRNRATGELENEKIFSEALFRWLFETPAGRHLYKNHLSRKWFSSLYGAWHSGPWSKRKIDRFVTEYGIRRDEFEAGPYPHFNAFFARAFKRGVRPFPTMAGEMGSPAEGRVLAFENVEQTKAAPLKGLHCDLRRLLPNTKDFEKGPVLILRLAPIDYHRFHLPDSGILREQFRDGRRLYSVHPFSLKIQDDVFLRNQRQVSIYDTMNFGRLAIVAVGAFCVGSILTREGRTRGDDIGEFRMGGSTLILLGEAGRWRPDSDLLAWSEKGVETFVRLGDRVARKTVAPEKKRVP